MPSLTDPVCTACGTQFPPAVPPEPCPICADDRQFITSAGQRWTSLEALHRSHRNTMEELEPGLFAISTVPDFAIGQRALLLRTAYGNILWDCIALLDDATIAILKAFGGLQGIAISHPHFYTTMVAWSHAFGGVPVYLHAADRRWVMRPDPVLRFWEGETHLLSPHLTLVHCGGHFPGGTVAYWSAGAEGRGVLLSGDVLQVGPDRAHVSFMHSYPNLIPLGPAAVRGIMRAVVPFPCDRIYGAFRDRTIDAGGSAAIARSAERYLQAIAPRDG